MYEVKTPLCSARDLERLQVQRKEERRLKMVIRASVRKFHFSSQAAPPALHRLGHQSAAFLPLSSDKISQLSMSAS